MEEEEEEEETEAQWLALALVPGAEQEVKEVEEHIEQMLIKLDEFCSISDMIRTDTSQLQDDVIHLIKAKVIEMNNIYNKVDKLETYTCFLQPTYNLPELYRTEDYFNNKYIGSKYQNC